MRRFGRFEGFGSRPARLVTILAAAIVALAVLAPPAVAKVRRPTQAWDPGIEEIAHQVEHLRGLRFRHPVPVDFDLGRGAGGLGDRIATGFSANPDSIAVARHLRALGLLAPGVDLAAEYRGMGSGPLGLYEPTTGTVHVGRRRLDAFGKEIVAHELTHALDDQHFHFERSIGRGELGARAAQAAIEGDARRIEVLYDDARPRAERRRARRELEAVNREYLKGVAHPGAIEWSVVQLDAPYTLGRALTSVVDALPGSGGVGTLLREGFDNDVGTVDPLEAGHSGVWAPSTVTLSSGEVSDGRAETLGAVDLYLLLASRASAQAAFDATSHLTGGYVAWFKRGAAACARMRVNVNSLYRAAALRGIDEWVTAMGPSAQRERVDSAGIVFSSCEGAPALALGAIVVPEEQLAARGQAIAKMLDAHATVVQSSCVGDAVLRDAEYRDRVPTAFVLAADRVPKSAFDAAVARGRALCGA
jgi:hypothetical protein